jgi:hypothetical protein
MNTVSDDMLLSRKAFGPSSAFEQWPSQNQKVVRQSMVKVGILLVKSEAEQEFVWRCGAVAGGCLFWETQQPSESRWRAAIG